MKTVVIDVNNAATAKLLLDLAKKMGLPAKIQVKKPNWSIMPGDDNEVETMIREAEESFAKGKGISTSDARRIIRSWK